MPRTALASTATLTERPEPWFFSSIDEKNAVGKYCMFNDAVVMAMAEIRVTFQAFSVTGVAVCMDHYLSKALGSKTRRDGYMFLGTSSRVGTASLTSSPSP